MSDLPCSEDGCENPAAKGGKCWAHVWRKRHGKAMSEPVAKRPESKIDVLREAALAYAEAESDEDFRRAEDKLRKAAERFGAETARKVDEMFRQERARRGGLARAAKLSAERRAEVARLAAVNRWKRSK